MIPTVVIDQVGKRFSETATAALDGISATIQSGRVTGLVGPDGAGKTTLLRLIAGLMRPTAGRIKIGGLDATTDSDSLRSSLGYMPQKFSLYEDLTVMENLTLYADLRHVVGGERAKTFERLLAFTDLGPFTKRLAGRLSGGMKQKLGLACTLLGRPKLLLLDEPSVGVDPISRRELWKMAQELVAEGMSVIWSTAYLDEAELCPEVLLVNEGKLLYAGQPGALTERVAGRCFQIRDIAGNRRELLKRVLRRDDIMDGVIQGDSIRIVTRYRDLPPAPVDLDAGPQARLVPVAPRFEDAFIDILGGGPGGDSVLATHLKPIPLDGAIVIEADHLTKKFGPFTATDDVNFAIKRGEIYGLLGPNGAGKSTTFKMMCGLLKPTSGSAHVVGIDLAGSASKARQRIGYMAQKFSLYSTLSVRQNLAFFSGAYGLSGRRQRVAMDEIVDVFALGPHLNESPGTMSLGFKQRLALACAVMHEPDILFLDEPTSGVDPVTRREFWNHINGVVGKGVTVMVTTHFMDEAEYCDRIGLVFRSRLIASGTPDALKREVASAARPDPTMEETFMELIKREGAA